MIAVVLWRLPAMTWVRRTVESTPQPAPCMAMSTVNTAIEDTVEIRKSATVLARALMARVNRSAEARYVDPMTRRATSALAPKTDSDRPIDPIDDPWSDRYTGDRKRAPPSPTLNAKISPNSVRSIELNLRPGSGESSGASAMPWRVDAPGRRRSAHTRPKPRSTVVVTPGLRISCSPARAWSDTGRVSECAWGHPCCRAQY